MTATVTHLPVPQPAPHPGSVAIAEAILAAGCGPEQIPWLVAGFRHAAELEQEIQSAMATLEGAPSLEEYLTSAGCAEITAAARGKCCTGIYCHCASGCLCGCGSCGCRPWPPS